MIRTQQIQREDLNLPAACSLAFIRRRWADLQKAQKYKQMLKQEQLFLCFGTVHNLRA
jgi:hypothetical protein